MASKPVFLDTLGLVGYLNKSDSFHNDAVELFKSFKKPRRLLITTTYIMAETGNSLARTPARNVAASFLLALWRNRQVQVIEPDQSLFLAGLERYQRHEDKQWGLVDCISFEVMDKAGLTEAFTADRHFEQAGFSCLLRGTH
jgi:uncharacterized protein